MLFVALNLCHLGQDLAARWHNTIKYQCNAVLGWILDPLSYDATIPAEISLCIRYDHYLILYDGPALLRTAFEPIKDVDRGTISKISVDADKLWRQIRRLKADNVHECSDLLMSLKAHLTMWRTSC